MDKTRSVQHSKIGDAAVDGLINGILAGILMGLVVLAAEMPAGISPLEVLTYFSVSADASPLLGLFTHIAISGIYGVIFGIVVPLIVRPLGARRNPVIGLVLGAVYGLLILAIAKGIVLPNTNSPLRELPLPAFGAAHLVYGIVLGWLTLRHK